MNAFEGVFASFKNYLARYALGAAVLALLIFLFPPLYGEGYNVVGILIGNEGAAEPTSVLNNSIFYGHNNYLLLFIALIALV